MIFRPLTTLHHCLKYINNIHTIWLVSVQSTGVVAWYFERMDKVYNCRRHPYDIYLSFNMLDISTTCEVVS
jgi:hypothetical protein